MRALSLVRFLATPAAALLGGSATAADVPSRPGAVSVTVYRSQQGGGFDLDELAGFALVTETRRVSLPAGESTLRFEGVAGGIEAESALVTGLPAGVIEKNRDARLLSPATLVAASLRHGVELERTNPKTGRRERVRGTLLSGNEGTIFQSAEGVEALRCSGLPETFSFEPFAGAHATPTLSVRVRSATPLTRTVTLSYLATGFDWSATYTATLAADGTHMNLGAWVTLANGNGESFRDAQTQVVAGRLNHDAQAPTADAEAGPILAQCWPESSTSSFSALPLKLSTPPGDAMPMMMRSLAAPAAAMQDMIVVTAARKVTQEQLGDLKLYRVPDRTTLAARQMKQVRLMDQYDVPVQQVYSVELDDEATGFAEGAPPVQRKLRTRNSTSDHLGLPLPSGRIAVFAANPRAALLVNEADLKDHAVDEEVEIDLGTSPDVHVDVRTEHRDVDSAAARQVPLLPGVALRSVNQRRDRRVSITNARDREAAVEVNLVLEGDERLIGADHPQQQKSGRPRFSIRVPAGGEAVLRYALARTQDLLVRPR